MQKTSILAPWQYRRTLLDWHFQPVGRGLREPATTTFTLSTWEPENRFSAPRSLASCVYSPVGLRILAVWLTVSTVRLGSGTQIPARLQKSLMATPRPGR